MTLREAIEQAHCRRGKAAGTTKDGAYWLAVEPIKIRDWGGNGIGNNSADLTNYLELRHYRDGEARARVHTHGWHQNGERAGAGDWYTNADAVLDCGDVESVIVALKRIRSAERDTAVYSDQFADELTAALVGMGLVAELPAPDGEAV